MYAMGEKYWIPDLKNHAKLLFPESIRYVSEASLCEVITEVYASTPETDRGLRDLVLDAVVKDLNEKMRNKELKKIALEVACHGDQIPYLFHRMFQYVSRPS
jgi:hypothetical protein